jgi:hypothetical protein
MRSIGDAKASPKLKAYQWVQHDIMFGDRYSYPTLFDTRPPVQSAGASTH